MSASDPRLAPAVPPATTPGRPQPVPPAGLGLTGKHPAFGDFIAAGLDPALRLALDDWLAQVLPALAQRIGPHWEALWDQSPGFGFWFGGQLFAASRGQALRGWLLPARDRIGRRWPLVIVQHPAPAEPPTLAPDDGFAAALVMLLPALAACAAATPADLLTVLAALPPAPAPAPMPALLWAVNPTLPTAQLWPVLAAHDHRRAAQGCSCLWTEPAPGRAGAVAALTGLPDAAMLAWCLCGPATDLPPETTPETTPETAPETTPEPPAAVPPADDPDPAATRPQAEP